MSWLKRLFGSESKTEKGTVEVPNIWGAGDGKPFVLPRNPNVSEVFANATQAERNILKYAYLNHPDAKVRLATVAELRKLESYHLSSQPLVDRLADPSPGVRRATASALWTNEEALDNALRCLRDEIHRTGLASTMSSQEALAGLEYLRSAAPLAKAAQFEEWVADIIGSEHSKPQKAARTQTQQAQPRVVLTDSVNKYYKGGYTGTSTHILVLFAPPGPKDVVTELKGLLLFLYQEVNFRPSHDCQIRAVIHAAANATDYTNLGNLLQEWLDGEGGHQKYSTMNQIGINVHTGVYRFAQAKWVTSSERSAKVRDEIRRIVADPLGASNEGEGQIRPDTDKLQAEGDVNGLVNALSYQRDNDVRLAAAIALVELEDTKGTDALLAMLRNNEDVDQDAVVDVLERVGGPQVDEVYRLVLQDAADRLLWICPRVTSWLRNSPEVPMRKIRAIGRILDQLGGKSLMRTVHAEFVQGGGRQYAREIEVMWSGIGTWLG